jgi:adenylate cyclase
MGRATKVIRNYHGYVNKFLGDGIMFFFNAPRTRAGYAADAVRCVLELEAMLREFNVELAERGLPPLAQRAGMTTGPMVVGDAGSAERCDYTVLGNEVNLSSRLEGANKAVGTSNLITERTLELADPNRDKLVVRPVGQIQVVGQTVGVRVYEVLSTADAATDDHRRLAELTKAVVELSDAGRQADCLEALNKLEDEFGESKLTHLYRDKCDLYLRDPAAGEWERQIVLTQK